VKKQIKFDIMEFSGGFGDVGTLITFFSLVEG